MNKEDQKKLVELFKSEIEDIIESNDSTLIKFKNGQVVPLYGEQAELKIPTCIFCNDPGTDAPLFTINDKHFICKNCVLMALETYLENGVTIDINMGEKFPGVVEQLKKLSDNIDSSIDDEENVINIMNNEENLTTNNELK
ncbi:MAG: hypothetical protein ACOCP8_04890 [archaeon]